jgi:hypothetical protein
MPDFSWYFIPNRRKIITKYTKSPENRPNVYTMYNNLPLQDPPKRTQIGIFGLKIYHLATLILNTHQAKLYSEHGSSSSYETPKVAHWNCTFKYTLYYFSLCVNKIFNPFIRFFLMCKPEATTQMSGTTFRSQF